MGRGSRCSSLSLSLSLSLSFSLLCNLLAATSPRSSSLPLAVSARGQRAHAPPSAYTLVLSRGRKEEEVVQRETAFRSICDRLIASEIRILRLVLNFTPTLPTGLTLALLWRWYSLRDHRDTREGRAMMLSEC